MFVPPRPQERILAADCPQQERQHYIRVLSSLCMAHQEQVGGGPQGQLLAPALRCTAGP